MNEDTEAELLQMICDTNRYPDMEWGFGMSYAYYFLDERGIYSVSSVSGIYLPTLIVYDEATQEFSYVRLAEAGSLLP